MNFDHRGILVAIAVVSYRASVLAYGPLGHEIVGAIADERLTNTPTGAKIDALLDGLRLEKAALLADEIKGWDKKGVDDPRSFHYSAHRNIDKQLRDFWRANQPTHDPNSSAPSHHWFHYTDVPVMTVQRYRDGYSGRSKWDVVHMIPFCIDVLKDESPNRTSARSRSLLPSFSLRITSRIFISPCTSVRPISMRKDTRPIPTATNQPWRM